MGNLAAVCRSADGEPHTRQRTHRPLELSPQQAAGTAAGAPFDALLSPCLPACGVCPAAFGFGAVHCIMAPQDKYKRSQRTAAGADKW